MTSGEAAFLNSERGQVPGDDTTLLENVRGICAMSTGGLAPSYILSDIAQHYGITTSSADQVMHAATHFACPGSAATEPPATSDQSSQGGINCPNSFVLPTVNPDCYFLDMMAKDQIHGDPTGLISSAHGACNSMTADTTGADPIVDEVAVLRQANPELTVQKAAQFAGIAAAAYCPSATRP
jgi:hypothetical protein